MTDTSEAASNISSKALTLSTGGRIAPIVPQNMEEAWRLGQAIVRSGMAPRGLETPDKCAIAIIAGLEVGLLPLQALQSIAVIGGRPSLFGDGALAVVRKSGLLTDISERFKIETMTATCICKRGAQIIRRTFSREDAQVAGLWDKRGRNGEPTPWQLYPRRMLQMRARAWALRDGFSDALRGLAIAEEQGDVIEGSLASTGGPPAMHDYLVPPGPEADKAAGISATERAERNRLADEIERNAILGVEVEEGAPVSQDEIDAAEEAVAEHEAELAEAKRAAQVAPPPEDEDDGGIPIGLRRR